MSAPLASIVYEPDPQLPLLTDTLPADPQTEIQREVQANLQHEIDSVLHFTGQFQATYRFIPRALGYTPRTLTNPATSFK